ncbi:MAG: hypothetical protein K9H25_07085, partial [Rhodospirillum sp.]|nr:hypothetical protein [Rhodospirillum sp.]
GRGGEGGGQGAGGEAGGWGRGRERPGGDTTLGTLSGRERIVETDRMVHRIQALLKAAMPIPSIGTQIARPKKR